MLVIVFHFWGRMGKKSSDKFNPIEMKWTIDIVAQRVENWVETRDIFFRCHSFTSRIAAHVARALVWSGFESDQSVSLLSFINIIVIFMTPLSALRKNHTKRYWRWPTKKDEAKKRNETKLRRRRKNRSAFVSMRLNWIKVIECYELCVRVFEVMARILTNVWQKQTQIITLT